MKNTYIDKTLTQIKGILDEKDGELVVIVNDKAYDMVEILREHIGNEISLELSLTAEV